VRGPTDWLLFGVVIAASRISCLLLFCLMVARVAEAAGAK